MSWPEMLPAVANQFAVVPVQFVSSVQFVSFWLSVSLPLAYVPLLYVGFEGSFTLFVVLLGVHVLTLMLGHGYDRERA